jgi:hypothetical protein
MDGWMDGRMDGQTNRQITEICNDNGVRKVSFASSEKLIFKCSHIAAFINFL